MARRISAIGEVPGGVVLVRTTMLMIVAAR
jgi:hypothetical protein